MTPTESDIIKLECTVDMLYISPQYYETSEATKVEIEIRQKLESYKSWAKNLIKDKLK